MLGLPFFNLTNIDYLITFFTMSSIYLALLLLIIVKEKDSLNRAIRDKINLEGTLSNRIIIIPLTYSILTIISFIIEIIQDQVGIETGVLSTGFPCRAFITRSRGFMFSVKNRIMRLM